MSESQHKGLRLAFAPWPWENAHARTAGENRCVRRQSRHDSPLSPPLLSVRQGSACASTGRPSACITSLPWRTAGSSSPAPSTGHARECTTATRTSSSPRWGTWCGPTSRSSPGCGCATTRSGPRSWREASSKSPHPLLPTFTVPALWSSRVTVLYATVLRAVPLCFHWKRPFWFWVCVVWLCSLSLQATVGSGVGSPGPGHGILMFYSATAYSWTLSLSLFFFLVTV